MKDNNVVAIFSGGLDSTVMVHLLASRNAKLKLLSFDYGQRHVKEIESAQGFAERLGLDHEVADLSALRHLLGGSSQTEDDVDVPEGHYAEESMKATVVPNRNMIMLAVAAGYAISQDFGYIAYGAHGGDHAIYPDCRPEFASVMDAALMLCDWKKVRLLRPFVSASKADIVGLGNSLGVPMHLTWSCYKGGEVHCGKCGTCVERREAFQIAGVQDLTAYAPDQIVVPDSSLRSADGAPADNDSPRIIDVEKISRVERQLVAEGKLKPVGK